MQINGITPTNFQPQNKSHSPQNNPAFGANVSRRVTKQLEGDLNRYSAETLQAIQKILGHEGSDMFSVNFRQSFGRWKVIVHSRIINTQIGVLRGWSLPHLLNRTVASLDKYVLQHDLAGEANARLSVVKASAE